MIELGMVEWLFQELSVVESSYSLEYGTALLMNLCLHLSAKERCVPIAQFVINLLLDLLSTPVIQVRRCLIYQYKYTLSFCWHVF